MSAMEESIDVRSDAESENTENCEDEYDPEDFSIEETPDIPDDILCPDLEAVDDTDEEDDTSLRSRLERTDRTWEAKKRSFFESSFFEHLGPKNLPDSVKTPEDVFLCLFSENLIAIIVKQSNLYCTQKKL